MALVDTGSDGCAITQALLDRMGGKPTSTVTVHEAGREPMDMGALEIRLMLPTGDEKNVIVGVLASMGGAHDFLIGRDFLCDGLLVVEFHNGRFEFHVPWPID